MRARRLVALAASGALLALLLLSEPPSVIARRAAFVAAASSRSLPERRLAGSGAAFDRRFFQFLEAARRALPPGLEGVVLDTPRDAPEELYLATYHLAPLPIVFTPRPIPARFASATYGVGPPPGWRVIARLPGGELSVPP